MSPPRPHVLAFSHDFAGKNCKLTILLNGVRFDIKAQGSELKEVPDIYSEYESLLSAVETHNGAKHETKASTLKEKNDPSKDSAVGSSPTDLHEDPQSLDGGDSDDSGVDVQEDEESTAQEQDKPGSPEALLQNWILAPFGRKFAKLAHEQSGEQQQTVYDWYNPTTHYFELELVQNNSEEYLVAPRKVEPSQKHIADHVSRLTPHMSLPKYIRESASHIPFVDAEDLIILDTSDEIPPIHPCLVRISESTSHALDHDFAIPLKEDLSYFLKTVDTTQPGPVKRELQILLKAQALQLREKHSINIPYLEAFVLSPSSSSTSTSTANPQILGFLLTPIPSPRPLTTLLPDPEPSATCPSTSTTTTPPSQPQLNTYTTEIQRILPILHSHDIIWGDAKADNFLVDSDDNLWIIDFGGSYTEGWVDEELAETEEGDWMGVGKTVEALEGLDGEGVEEVQGKDETAERLKEGDKDNRKRKRRGEDTESAGAREEGDTDEDKDEDEPTRRTKNRRRAAHRGETRRRKAS